MINNAGHIILRAYVYFTEGDRDGYSDRNSIEKKTYDPLLENIAKRGGCSQKR